MLLISYFLCQKHYAFKSFKCLIIRYFYVEKLKLWIKNKALH